MSYQADFLDPQVADELFRGLTDGVEWQRHRVRLFGRWVDCPRLSAWYGDPDAMYAYSGVEYSPLPWTSELAHLRARVQTATGQTFN